jgi:hypothetical protein
MLTNSTVLLVRHDEKNGDPCEDGDGDPGLSPAGQARAAAYVQYFENLTIRSLDGTRSQRVKLNSLFAAKDSANSERPRLTLEPLAAARNLPFDYSSVADKDYDELVSILLGTAYDNSTILVCWHHGQIVQLADNLLVANGNPMPNPSPAATWPQVDTWPCEVFGWLMQICYDDQGYPDTSWVRCSNEQLMPDDTLDPP